MEKESKSAPLISFNHHFKYEHHDSDEELLVVNTPQKKLEKLEVKEFNEKESMTENESNTHASKVQLSNATNALIIGEMPINIDTIYQENKKVLNDLSINCSNEPGTFWRAPIIPYIIMPFSNNTKNIKIKETIVEHVPTQIQKSNTNNIQTDILELKDNMQNIEVAEKKSDTSTYVSVQREKWSHKTEFLLAIIGFSVDLGNIWRCKKIFFEPIK